MIDMKKVRREFNEIIDIYEKNQKNGKVRLEWCKRYVNEFIDDARDAWYENHNTLRQSFDRLQKSFNSNQ